MRKLLVVAALDACAIDCTCGWLFTPNVGGVFGGPAAGGATWGATIGWMGDRILSAEAISVSPATTCSVQPRRTSLYRQGLFRCQSRHSHGQRARWLSDRWDNWRGRPFFAGGLGLIRTNVQGVDELFDRSENLFGLSLGGGAYGFVTDTFGFRGDVRWYFHYGSRSGVTSWTSTFS